VLDEDEYTRWIEFSKKTLGSAKGDLERGDHNWARFKAQQAAEFAAKAVLHGLGRPAYGHSVSALLQAFPGEHRPKEELLQMAKMLDRYYVPTRYPNAWAQGSPDEFYTLRDAEDAVISASAVVEWVDSVWRSLRRGEG